ncbi:MAG: NADH-quinone oxidoreductase subunit NuoH [Halobacteriovoraceae bacterium]|nr:NADH-quinone oxidoreductase subunit NuoH [Halobacteriovoraceae bacterium]
MNSHIVSFLLNFEVSQKIMDSINNFLGFDALSLVSFLIFFVAAFIVANAMAVIGGLGTYAERKISADLQARQGPNRVGPYGLLQFIADFVKLISKEDIIPKKADKLLYTIAPVLCMVGIMGTLAVIPYSSGFILTDLNIGVFYLLGVSSLIGVGIFLGGYSSNSKWSMLGGMRGASQIISYEIPVTLSILAVVLLAGGVSMQTLVKGQEGGILNWFIFHNPFSFIAFFVYFIGALAEANRAPFDLPEAESELVSGYHTEYSGMRFSFFALAEYIEVFVLSSVAAALFLGGHNVPFNFGKEIFIGQFLQLGVFLAKAFALFYIVIWIRWTLPRLRVDQLMTVCWKYLTPIGIFNLIGCAIWMYAFSGKSLYMLLFKSAH